MLRGGQRGDMEVWGQQVRTLRSMVELLSTAGGTHQSDSISRPLLWGLGVLFFFFFWCVGD